jgi:hypothetical protein
MYPCLQIQSLARAYADRIIAESFFDVLSAETGKGNFPFLLATRVTWDRCYDFKNIFAKKCCEKNCRF